MPVETNLVPVMPVIKVTKKLELLKKHRLSVVEEHHEEHDLHQSLFFPREKDFGDGLIESNMNFNEKRDASAQDENLIRKKTEQFSPVDDAATPAFKMQVASSVARGTFGAKRLQSVDDSFSAMIQPQAPNEMEMLDEFDGIDEMLVPLQENEQSDVLPRKVSPFFGGRSSPETSPPDQKEKPKATIKVKKLDTFAPYAKSESSDSSSLDDLRASKEVTEQQQRVENESGKEDRKSDALDTLVWNRKKSEHKRGPSPYLSNVKLSEPPQKKSKPQ